KLRGVEHAHVLDRTLDRCDLLRRQRTACSRELLATDRELAHLHTVELLRVRAQRGIAVATHGVDDLSHAVQDIRALILRGARERGALAFGIERIPLEDFHRDFGHGQASIFSTGNTRRALAPAFFRLSSVSQNTFSRHTACTATLSGW